MGRPVLEILVLLHGLTYRLCCQIGLLLLFSGQRPVLFGLVLRTLDTHNKNYYSKNKNNDVETCHNNAGCGTEHIVDLARGFRQRSIGNDD
jgi:hypothetical protein